MLDYAGADAPPVERAGAIDVAVLDALHEPGQGRVATHLWGEDLLARLRPRLSSRQAVLVGRALGPARAVLRPLQMALTILALPLVLLGAAAVACLAPRRAAFLLAVPAYQVAFQSIVHFEFRYVLPMHACLTVFAGAALALAAGLVVPSPRRGRPPLG
jgi:hypothetical protein